MRYKQDSNGEFSKLGHEKVSQSTFPKNVGLYNVILYYLMQPFSKLPKIQRFQSFLAYDSRGHWNIGVS